MMAPLTEPQRTQSSPSRKRRRSVVIFVTFVVLLSVAGLVVHAQVSFDRLLRADREPQNWLTYSGTSLSQRFSQLTQITPENVKNLEL